MTQPAPQSKLVPYRLPFSIFVFFVAYALLTHTPLFFISSITSSFIHYLYTPFDAVNEAGQVTVIYAILCSVLAHFWFGKLCKIEPEVNKKGLLKGLGLVVLIIAAYGLNLAQQS
ncbi:hypothetical protein DS885_07180 [Psychromonas sp. B3M02]|uniref:hypothetical protein n=1 Tax=Psychromonas sp. B3M02 TaxID=2267226 RepID=UPI000DE924F2|nr:hypothetical protein [Psychromonas sp. B3M02]RBW46642.1 hypothetical protein DS885_07180 [Psychromonas sp. B3M02]